MGNTLTVALVSMKHRENDVAFNLAQHEKWLSRALETGAQFVGFPEFSLTGWVYEPQNALSLDSAPVLQIREWANRFKIAIGSCLVEKDGRSLYNTCIVATPAGELYHMRKINLIAKEAAHYARGREIPVFQIAGCTVGIAICADASNFEMLRLPSLQGAEVVFSPHANSLGAFGNSPAGWLKWRSERWPLFARHCGIAILGINNAGLFENHKSDDRPTKYCGGGAVFDWNGQVVAQAPVRLKRECLFSATLDLAALRVCRAEAWRTEFQGATIYNRAFDIK